MSLLIAVQSCLSRRGQQHGRPSRGFKAQRWPPSAQNVRCLSFTSRLSRDDLISRAHTRARSSLLLAGLRALPAFGRLAKLGPSLVKASASLPPSAQRTQTYFHSSKSVHSSFLVHSGKLGHRAGGLRRRALACARAPPPASSPAGIGYGEFCGACLSARVRRPSRQIKLRPSLHKGRPVNRASSTGPENSASRGELARQDRACGSTGSVHIFVPFEDIRYLNQVEDLIWISRHNESAR